MHPSAVAMLVAGAAVGGAGAVGAAAAALPALPPAPELAQVSYTRSCRRQSLK